MSLLQHPNGKDVFLMGSNENISAWKRTIVQFHLFMKDQEQLKKMQLPL
jgi:hypothetical protein